MKERGVSMFCSKCGKEVTASVAFCVGCGTPVGAHGTPAINHPDASSASRKGLSLGSKLSLSGAAIALACFFLPWVSIGISAELGDKFSGWMLAFGTDDWRGRPALFLVLLAAIAVLGLTYFSYRRGAVTMRDVAWTMAAAIVALGIIVFQVPFTAYYGGYLKLTVGCQFCLWATIAGFVGILAGSVINRNDICKTKKTEIGNG